MYNITVSKITYQLKGNRTYKQKQKLFTTATNDLINEMLRLKAIYKEFNYIIEFNKS